MPSFKKHWGGNPNPQYFQIFTETRGFVCTCHARDAKNVGVETPTYNAIMFSGFRRNAKFKLEIIHQNKRFQSFKTKVFRPSRKLRREVPDLWGSIFSPGRKVSKVRNMFPYEFAVISKFCKNGRVRLLRHNNKATSEAGEKTRCVTAV